MLRTDIILNRPSYDQCVACLTANKNLDLALQTDQVQHNAAIHKLTAECSDLGGSTGEKPTAKMKIVASVSDGEEGGRQEVVRLDAGFVKATQVTVYCREALTRNASNSLSEAGASSQ